jgi:tetratricopeptide (TPR) repeat protein
LLGLAQAQFAAGSSAAARMTLDRLIAQNPDFKSPEGHLLYARALEGEGNLSKALEEYAAVAAYFAGAEAPLRHALLQAKLGQRAAAKQTLSALLEHAQLAPRHYARHRGMVGGRIRREIAALREFASRGWAWRRYHDSDRKVVQYLCDRQIVQPFRFAAHGTRAHAPCCRVNIRKRLARILTAWARDPDQTSTAARLACCETATLFTR